MFATHRLCHFFICGLSTFYMSWKCSKFLDVCKLFFWGQAALLKKKSRMARLSGHRSVCVYVYMFKFVFDQKSIIKHFRRCYYLPDSLLCCATFVTLGNGVSAQLLLWRRVAVHEPKKQEDVENMELASKTLHMIIPKTLII